MEARQQQAAGGKIPLYGGGSSSPLETVAPRKMKFRDEETRKIIELLNRKSTGVLVTGESGVGKTALIRNVAYALTLPSAGDLCDREVMLVKVDELVKFVSTPFDIDNRVCGALNDVMSKGGIAFIDDIDAYTANDMVDLLTINNFVRNGLKMIMCSTPTFKREGRLRNFAEISLKELTDDQTREVLEDECRSSLLPYTISPDVLGKLVESAGKYKWKLNKRTLHQPGSSFSLYEAVIAREQYSFNESHIRVKTPNWAESMNSGDVDFNRLLLEKSDYRAECLSKRTRAQYNDRERVISIDSVYDVLQRYIGVNINTLQSDSVTMLRGLGDKLKSQVFGQDEVIDKLVRSIKRNRLGVAKKKGAMCNYMFIGATGTGKTFLAKKLAAELYGSEDNLLRYDMSEYSDEISVNKLIGAPPGYVGYTEGGMLIKDLESHPQCVILFDEVEKAHPAIYNLLLQLLDEGHITDNAQHKASVKDCVIILTSNVGVKSALDYKSVGYSSDDAKKRQNDAAQKSIIENQLHRRFAPEFLNRLDGVCYFENLGDNEYNRIYDREISLARKEIAELGYSLKVDENVRPVIVGEAKAENLGARALLRVIQQRLLDVATNLIVDNEGGKRAIRAAMNKSDELVVKLYSK